MNHHKIEIMIVSHPSVQKAISQEILPVSSRAQPIVRKIGVVLDQSLSFDAHIKSLTQFCFFSFKTNLYVPHNST